MSLAMADVVRILIAITLLVLLAHLGGHLFALLRQPPVIGEILGGLLLGPSVLGYWAPSVMDRLLPATGPTAAVLGAFSQLGLVFLMFLAGSELPRGGSPAERRTVLMVTVSGLTLPFVAGLVIVRFLDTARLSGPHGSATTVTLVFGIAVAVTSIPVISRILLDLGMLNTPFARIVLSVAVLEDIALYVVLAVTLGLVQARSADYGLWALLGSDSMTWSAVYHVGVSILFLSVFLLWGGRIFGWLVSMRFNGLERRSPVAFRVLFLLALVLCAVALGINAVFGALVAGISAARGDAGGGTRTGRTWDSLRQFLLGFFVPVYFALVGVQLDVIHHFPVLIFLVFFVLACAVKVAGVWIGARLAGRDRETSLDLAVAMNARGGPGIVLAAVTFGAGVINEDFFTILVVFSVVTSQLAGIWLDRVHRHRGGSGLTPEAPADAAVGGGDRRDAAAPIARAQKGNP
ncbi:cation:proton antiporter [Microbispora sp. RL4-1S]|uniref:Cation:proton antiporter n=1 Tax=Microbispora oryzae TaxID=2806554 RepID=A0A940WJ24_9ACTN|nr:cation:proton antiporter [Microbispora oryzae]MBP2705863.1 cation:proton antiporter [Microbispora oryzae]